MTWDLNQREHQQKKLPTLLQEKTQKEMMIWLLWEDQQDFKLLDHSSWCRWRIGRMWKELQWKKKNLQRKSTTFRNQCVQIHLHHKLLEDQWESRIHRQKTILLMKEKPDQRKETVDQTLQSKARSKEMKRAQRSCNNWKMNYFKLRQSISRICKLKKSGKCLRNKNPEIFKKRNLSKRRCFHQLKMSFFSLEMWSSK